MKVKCPVCGRIGTLDVRGNSYRVIHYRYVDGKRVFERHHVDKSRGQELGLNQYFEIKCVRCGVLLTKRNTTISSLTSGKVCSKCLYERRKKHAIEVYGGLPD